MRIDTVVSGDLFPAGLRAGDTLPLRIGDVVFSVDVLEAALEPAGLRLTLEIVDAEVTPWGHPAPHHPPAANRHDTEIDPSAFLATDRSDFSARVPPIS